MYYQDNIIFLNQFEINILFLKEGGGGEVYTIISSMYLPPPQGEVHVGTKFLPKIHTILLLNLKLPKYDIQG